MNSSRISKFTWQERCHDVVDFDVVREDRFLPRDAHNAFTGRHRDGEGGRAVLHPRRVRVFDVNNKLSNDKKIESQGHPSSSDALTDFVTSLLAH